MLTPGMRQAARLADSSAAQITQQFENINRSGKRMAASVDELRDRLDAINRVRFATTVQREFDTATRAANRLERQIERLESRGRNGGFSLGGILSSVGLAAGGNDVIRTGIQHQGLNRAINFTTGGRGTEAVSHIDAQGEKLGLNVQAGLEGFKTLSGGLKGLNMDLSQQMQIFDGVNAGIATYALNGENSKRVYLALGQIASKGTVQAEELRGQIGEVIPGAFSIAAKAMGVTEQQLNKLMDKGELMSKDFLPRFAQQMQKEFGQSAIEAATGAAANMNRFDNTMLQIKKTFAEDLLPPFLTVLGVLRTGLQWVADNKDVLLPLVAGIATVVVITQGWAIAQSLVNTVMAMNPIILIIGLVVALGLWIYNLSKKYEGWGKSMQGLWQTIKGFIKLNLIGWKELGESIWYWIQYAWLKVKGFVEWIGGAMNNVWNAIKLASQFKFGEAKAALTAEIKTTASTQLAELEKRHKTGQINNQQEAFAALKQMQDGWNMIGLKKKTGAVTPTSANLLSGSGTVPEAFKGMGDGTKAKADSINSGGQRSITIHIGKQIEKLEVHVMNAKEGAQEIELQVREALRRVLYSMNGVVN